MNLALMQPYFFPYIGYFDLINRVDSWVVFDTAQFTPQTWMNRNRILHPERGWHYVTVPVTRHSTRGPIKDVVLGDPQGSRRRILAMLDHYRHREAPYFDAAYDLVDRCFAGLRSDKLAELNVRSLELTCAYLGIAFDPIWLSRAGLKLPETAEPGVWGLQVAAAMGASEYVNAPGGRALFDPAAFAARGIKLTFADLVDFRYEAPGAEFIEHLSILDVIMWNDPLSITAFLQDSKQRTGTPSQD